MGCILWSPLRSLAMVSSVQSEPELRWTISQQICMTFPTIRTSFQLFGVMSLSRTPVYNYAERFKSAYENVQNKEGIVDVLE